MLLLTSRESVTVILRITQKADQYYDLQSKAAFFPDILNDPNS